MEPRSGINNLKKKIMYDEQAQTKEPEDEQGQGRTEFGMNMSDVKGCVYHCAIRMFYWVEIFSKVFQ